MRLTLITCLPEEHIYSFGTSLMGLKSERREEENSDLVMKDYTSARKPPNKKSMVGKGRVIISKYPGGCCIIFFFR